MLIIIVFFWLVIFLSSDKIFKLVILLRFEVGLLVKIKFMFLINNLVILIFCCCLLLRLLIL